MSHNNDLRRSVGKLKQMAQFGSGNTFQDLMNSFETIGEELIKIWPWVPFSPDGDIQCTIFPTDKDRGYELILVATEDSVRFPNDRGVLYKIAKITQHIHVIEGRIGIEYADRTEWIEEGCVGTIPSDTPLALHYKHGFFLFKQVPRIARAEDFSFEF